MIRFILKVGGEFKTVDVEARELLEIYKTHGKDSVEILGYEIKEGRQERQGVSIGPIPNLDDGDVSVNYMGLSLRCINVLAREGIHTAKQLANLTEIELIKFDGMGLLGYRSIIEGLKQLGLELKGGINLKLKWQSDLDHVRKRFKRIK